MDDLLEKTRYIAITLFKKLQFVFLFFLFSSFQLIGNLKFEPIFDVLFAPFSFLILHVSWKQIPLFVIKKLFYVNKVLKSCYFSIMNK